ncbi:hypothetical protein SVAN01_05799 [Stagonosporopsis vannaccii]|nr:hypothetical protein SVAN01_05799 [Stagonosporopsis vannaccii]
MSVVLRTAVDVAASVGARIAHTTDRLFPPKQRERALESLRAFSVRNPKLASFLAVQVALAGLPILLFLGFAVSTLAVSLITCIFLGVIAAFVFTLLVTGLALLFVVPVVCIGSCTASIVFLWGLIGFLILQRINGGEAPVQPGTKVGDTLNGLTGGRLRDLVDGSDAHPQQERLVVDPSGGKEMSMEQRRPGAHNTRSHSPRRRHHGHADRSSHSGEAGEESQEGRAQSVHTGTGYNIKGARDLSEPHVTSYDPAGEKVVDWKTEFQREGIAA